MKTLKELIQGVETLELRGNAEVKINAVQFDSRKIMTGDLFVATRGTLSDGHDFIPMAIEKGAAAIICESLPNPSEGGACLPPLGGGGALVVVKDSLEALGLIASAWYDNPSEQLTLVGVTGTNGKTTTTTLLYELFRKFGYKAGLLSTVCNYIDSEVVVATHTTPDPLELNSLLARMVEAGCEYAFMEVSSHSVVQHRIAGLRFAGGIFTNLTQDHLDYHKTMAEYLKAKKLFFDNLPASAFALTNVDDRNGLVMLQNTRAKKYTYSVRTLADFKAKILEESFEGMLLEMNGREVFVPFIGRFNAYNLLAVFGAATLLCRDLACHVSTDEILTALSALKPVSGRFEAIRSPKGWTAIVDYAHTPDALKNVLNTINEIRQGNAQVITVCGCGGDRDKTKRPLMAREAFEGSSRVIFTSDNPRSEDPQAILNDMLAGLTAAEQNQVLSIVDRKESIKTACALAQAGDVILIAGKGHEDYQIIGKEKFHFDDHEVVKLFI